MQWRFGIYLMNLAWMVLHGWITTCLLFADEIAIALRNGDVGPPPLI